MFILFTLHVEKIALNMNEHKYYIQILFFIKEIKFDVRSEISSKIIIYFSCMQAALQQIVNLGNWYNNYYIIIQMTLASR
jgi:hypothetical protein